jgi:L-lysine epsilon oxidase C-terminal domain/L-Lysine epsilon oxidase N-terminal
MGAQTIEGRTKGPVKFAPRARTSPKNAFALGIIDYLGELHTDAAGRLIVVGGTGKAAADDPAVRPLDRDYNNPGWFDDVSDGPVTGMLKLKDGDGVAWSVDVVGAWAVVAPPKFAPALRPAVSLWDVMFDLAARGKVPIPSDEAVYWRGDLRHLGEIAGDLGTGTSLDEYLPSYDRDVWPILQSVRDGVWVSSASFTRTRGNGSPARDEPSDLWGAVSQPHVKPPSYTSFTEAEFQKRGDELRGGIADGFQDPNAKLTRLDVLPELFGDLYRTPDRTKKLDWRRNMCTITTTQYGILQRWAEGSFLGSAFDRELDWQPAITEIRPAGLDQAALETVIGGPFYPGVEVGWLVRQPSLYAEPFRIAHDAASALPDERRLGAVAQRTVGPGYFTRQVGVPWHATFASQPEEELASAFGGNDGLKVMLGLTKAQAAALKKEIEEWATIVWGWFPSHRPVNVFANTDRSSKKRINWVWIEEEATVGQALKPQRLEAGRMNDWDSGVFDSDAWVARWWQLPLVVPVERNSAIQARRRVWAEVERSTP